MDTNECRHATDKAAEYLVRLEDPELSRADREHIVDWLRESPLHVAEMLRVAQVNGALAQFRNWEKIVIDPPDDTSNVVALRREPASGATRAGPRVSLRALAATLVVAALAIGSWALMHGTRTVETVRGERREMILEDGSRLEIDPETRVRVKYASDVRNIFLDTGRALFKVAKDEKRPFVVHAEGTLVRAVGTEFGVEHVSDTVVVTVAEGRVTVGPAAAQTKEKDQIPMEHNAALQGADPVSSGTAHVFLGAGQQVVVPRFGSAQPVVRQVDSGRELAWADGRLIFDNDTVASVIEQFNRYNRLQLHVDDASLAKRAVSGVFYASDPQSFLAFMRDGIGVHAVRDDDRDITLVPDPDAAP
jgi:transmembrane sensor